MDGEVLSNVSHAICTTCLHSYACALQQAGIWDCSEFEIPKTAINEAKFTTPNYEATNYAPGLCTSCDLAASCTWRKDNTSIFYCEHYE